MGLQWCGGSDKAVMVAAVRGERWGCNGAWGSDRAVMVAAVRGERWGCNGARGAIGL